MTFTTEYWLQAPALQVAEAIKGADPRLHGEITSRFTVMRYMLDGVEDDLRVTLRDAEGWVATFTILTLDGWTRITLDEPAITLPFWEKIRAMLATMFPPGPMEVDELPAEQKESVWTVWTKIQAWQEAAIQEDAVEGTTLARPSTGKERGVTKEVADRAQLFLQILRESPHLTQMQVARAAAERYFQRSGGRKPRWTRHTVSNDFRAMGWSWNELKEQFGDAMCNV